MRRPGSRLAGTTTREGSPRPGRCRSCHALTAALLLAVTHPGLAQAPEDPFAGLRTASTLRQVIPPGATWETTAFRSFPEDPRGRMLVRRYRVPFSVIPRLGTGAVPTDLAAYQLEEEVLDVDGSGARSFTAPATPGLYLWAGRWQYDRPGALALIHHEAVLVSRLGLGVRAGPTRLLVLAIDLLTGTPVENLGLRVLADGVEHLAGRTGPDGLLALDRPLHLRDRSLVIRGQEGEHLALAFVPPSPPPPPEPPAGCVALAHRLFRPGERVAFGVLHPGLPAGSRPGICLLDREGRVVQRLALPPPTPGDVVASQGGLELPEDLEEGVHGLGLQDEDGTTLGAPALFHVRHRRVAPCAVVGRWWWSGEALELRARAVDPAGRGVEGVAITLRSGTGAPVQMEADREGRLAGILHPGAADPVTNLAPRVVDAPPHVTLRLHGEDLVVPGPGGATARKIPRAVPGEELRVDLTRPPALPALRWVILERQDPLASVVCSSAPGEVSLPVPPALEPGPAAVLVVTLAAGSGNRLTLDLRATEVLVGPREVPVQLGVSEEGGLEASWPAGLELGWLAAWGEPGELALPVRAPRSTTDLLAAGGLLATGTSSLARAAQARARPAQALRPQGVALSRLGLAPPLPPEDQHEATSARAGGVAVGLGDPPRPAPWAARPARGLGVVTALPGAPLQVARISGPPAPGSTELLATPAAPARGTSSVWWVPVWGGRLAGGTHQLPVRALPGARMVVVATRDPARVPIEVLQPPAPGPLRPSWGGVEERERARWLGQVRDVEDPLVGALALCRLHWNARPGEPRAHPDLAALASRVHAQAPGSPAIQALLAGLPEEWGGGARMVEQVREDLADAAGPLHTLRMLVLPGTPGVTQALEREAAWLALSPWLRARAAEAVTVRGRGAPTGNPWPPVRLVNVSRIATEVRAGEGFVEARVEPPGASTLQVMLPPLPAGATWWVAVAREAVAVIGGPTRRALTRLRVTATGSSWEPTEDLEVAVAPGEVLGLRLEPTGLEGRRPCLLVQPLPRGLVRLEPEPGGTLAVRGTGGAQWLVEGAPGAWKFEAQVQSLLEPGERVRLPPPRVVFLLESRTAGILQVPEVILRGRAP